MDIVIIIGDFNLGDSADWHENDDGFDYLPVIGESQSAKAVIAREVTSELLNLGLSQMSNFINSSGNVLELVYTNNPELAVVNKADFLMLPEWKSDKHHVPLMCTVECSPTTNTAGDPNSIYCFKRANYDEIRDHLSNVDIMHLIGNGSTDDMVDNLYKFIYDIFDEFVPREVLRVSSKPKWHDKQLSHLKNVRNKKYKTLCENRKLCQTANDREFVDAKFEYEQYRKQLLGDFLREKASEVKTNPKSFWGYINGKRKPNQLPAVINYGNEQAKIDEDKAHLFSQFFSTVYNDHIPDNELISFIEQRNDANCFKLKIEIDTVFHTLSTLDINKGSGYDGVSAIFLRECANFLASPLHTIFSSSLENCFYPGAFKIGQITPIFKAGRKTEVTNYRGVSVVPMLAKVFDRLTYQQLKLMIQPHISSSQHGFPWGYLPTLELAYYQELEEN